MNNNLSINSNNNNIENTVLDTDVPDEIKIMIERQKCIYCYVDLSKIQKKLHAKRITLTIKQITPFPIYEHYIIWKNGHAMVWIWQSVKIDASKTNKVQVIPESLFYGKTHFKQLELIQLHSGFEARYWDEELIKGSKFWLNKPTLEEWNLFLKNHALENHNEVPNISSNEINSEPWYQPNLFETLFSQIKQFNLSFIVLSIFIIIISYQLTSISRILSEIEKVETIKNDALVKANDIITARNNAVDNLNIITEIEHLSKWPTQIELLAKCTKVLNELDARLLRWDFNNGELLLTAKTNNTDTTKFIKEFEALNIFENVNINVSGNQNNLSLEMTLISLKSLHSSGDIK